MERSYMPNPVNSLVSCGSLNAEFQNYSQKISILLHQPAYKTRILNINRTYPISVLNKFYQQNSTYILNGEILDINKSFSEYQITDRSIIVIISPKMAKYVSNSIDNFIQMSKDEHFQQKIMIQTNKNNKQEVARIRDIRLMKNEMKRKIFKNPNSIENYYNNIFDMNVKPNDPKNEIHLETESKSEELSCEPLPKLW